MATASDRRLAEPVANRLGIFKQVPASDGHRYLKGARKLEAILANCNGSAFDYAGSKRVDFAILAKARRFIVVNPGMVEIAAAKKRRFYDCPSIAKTWDTSSSDRLSRPKMLLLGVPILTTHAFNFAAIAAGYLSILVLALSAVAQVTVTFHYPQVVAARIKSDNGGILLSPNNLSLR